MPMNWQKFREALLTCAEQGNEDIDQLNSKGKMVIRTVQGILYALADAVEAGTKEDYPDANH